MMRAGTLRHRVTLQSPTGTRDSYGQRTTTWDDVATVWASIEQLDERERFAAAQLQASATHRVRVRYETALAAINATWRVLFGERVFVLAGPPNNVGERGLTLELLCTEGERVE